MSASQSQSRSVTDTQTTTIADSYNRTENYVSNLSDVGNVSVVLGDAGSTALPPASTLLPLAAVVGAFALGLVLLRR